jgi:hypothetical protein
MLNPNAQPNNPREQDLQYFKNKLLISQNVDDDYGVAYISMEPQHPPHNLLENSHRRRSSYQKATVEKQYI